MIGNQILIEYNNQNNFMSLIINNIKMQSISQNQNGQTKLGQYIQNEQAILNNKQIKASKIEEKEIQINKTFVNSNIEPTITDYKHQFIVEKQQKHQQLIELIQSSMKTNEFRSPTKRNRKNNCVYERSNNNSHKKFMSSARKSLFKLLTKSQRSQFIHLYQKYKSSRVYFFILLNWAKKKLNSTDLFTFRTSFREKLREKIQKYEREINNSNKDNNLRKFRLEEIEDIKLAIKSEEKYFEGELTMALDHIYRKNRKEITKKNEFKKCLSLMKQIQPQTHESKGFTLLNLPFSFSSAQETQNNVVFSTRQDTFNNNVCSHEVIIPIANRVNNSK